jgi:hypothetical protein
MELMKRFAQLVFFFLSDPSFFLYNKGNNAEG